MGARMEKSNRRIALIGFAILMVGLGISDSLRGIFSGIFQTHFALTAKGLSTIIAVSYLYDRALGATYLNGLWEAITKEEKRHEAV